MKLIYATYIDNQSEINYPVKYIAGKLPNLLVYCSDAANQKFLAAQGIEATIIGVKINQPGDIATAQNKCIDHIFLVHEPDFIVWNQADIFISEKGHQIIKDFCVEGNLDQTAALGLMHIKLFHHCGHTYYGVNIIGKKAWPRIKFTGDGAYLGQGGADYCAKEDSSIDIGYLTIDQCRAHLKRHKQTWASNDTITELPDSEFVKAVVKRYNYSGLIPETSPYYELIKDMGLENEYKKVKELL